MISANVASNVQRIDRRNGTSPSGLASTLSEYFGAMAAALHAGLFFEGLELRGVDPLTSWDGPDMETNEVL